MLSTEKKFQSSLQLLKRSVKTLRVLSTPALQRETRRKLGSEPPRIHTVEPQRLPADFCEIKRKKYRKLKPQRGTGFRVPEELLGSLIVAKVSKSCFDTIIYVFRLCRGTYTRREFKSAKRCFHDVQRYFRLRWEFFEPSRFVRQSLKALKITFRMAERCL